MIIKHILCFALILTTLTSCGQEKYKFVSKINPEKTYTLSMNVSSLNKVKYLSDNPDLKDKTVESNDSTKMTRITTTERISDNGNFPATIKYGNIISISNGIEKTNPISGTIVKGTYSDNKFKAQEVISDNLNEKTKDAIKYALENVKPDIDFPKEPLKIGDSFEHKIPMTIPVESANPVKVEIVKIFTLKTVENNIAIFDLKEDIKLDLNIEQKNAIVKGQGNGVVEFDILENQIVKNNASFKIELDVKVNDDLTLNSIVEMNSEIKTLIE